MDSFGLLTQWLTARMRELGVPGAAVGVSVGGQRLTTGIGMANADTGAAFTPSTPVGIASLTNIVTATTVALLASDGALALDDPVQRHLPAFHVADPEASSTVTIGHLLSHAAGWADSLEPVAGADDLAWYAERMGDIPQIVPVGTHFTYSNSAFMLAGAAIERVTGMTYEHIADAAILRPLGMTHTAFAQAIAPGPERAIGHDLLDGEWHPVRSEGVPRAINPAAGLVSTLDDMLAFVEAHADVSPRTLDAGSLAMMRRPRIAGGSLGPVVVDHIGAGWMLLDVGGESVLLAQGGDAGMISGMVAVPGRRFGMVGFANSESALLLINDTILRGLSGFLGLNLPAPTPCVPSPDKLAACSGRFSLPDWLAFEISASDATLHLTTRAGDHVLPDLSGPLVMTSPSRGYLPHLGSRIWIDLVPDDAGRFQWLRFAARLVPRDT
ncbi:MAG: serine hydrolase domain-containing protein [Thermomicrobiales bacterium]